MPTSKILAFGLVTLLLLATSFQIGVSMQEQIKDDVVGEQPRQTPNREEATFDFRSQSVHQSGLPKVDDIYFKAYPGATPEVIVDEFIDGVTDWIEGPHRADLYFKVLGNNTYGDVHDRSEMDPVAACTIFAINNRDYKETSGDPNAPLNDSTWRLALSYVYGMDDKAADIFNYYGVPWHVAQRNPVPDAQEPWYDNATSMPNTSNFTAWNITMQPGGYSVADYSGQQWVYRNGVVVRPPDGPNGGKIRCLYPTGALFYEQGPLLGMVTSWNEFITGYVGADGPLMELTPVDYLTTVWDLYLFHDYDIIATELVDLGRYVDWLYSTLHSDNDVPWGGNFCGIHDSDFDMWGEIILASLNENQIIEATENLTRKFVYELMPWFPVRVGLAFCTTANATTNHQGHLTNVISMDSYGPRNDWSWMAMHWEGTPGVVWPGGSYAVALGDEPGTLNPWTERSSYGWEMMDRALLTGETGLVGVNPDTLENMPFVATNWTVDHWVSVPELGISSGSIATFYLRQDVKWQDYDVTGEMVDAYDCVANMRFMREHQPGRYSKIWAHLMYEEADGPYTFNVYFDQTSLYYANYVAEASLLVPEHIIEAVDENVTGGLANYADWSPCDDDYKDLTGKAPPAAYPWMKQLVGCGPFVFRNYDRGLAIGRVTKFDDFFINAPVIGSVVGEWRVNPLEGYEYRPLIHNLGAKEAIDEGPVTSVTVDVAVYEDGVLTHVVNDTVLGPWEWTYLGPYTFSAANTTIGEHTITVKIYGSSLLHTYEHKFVATIREDLDYDFRVTIFDVSVAMYAHGSYPGHQNWCPLADVNDDFHVDARDVGAVARKRGWNWYPRWMTPDSEAYLVVNTGGKTVVCSTLNLTVLIELVNVVNLREYVIIVYYDETLLDLVGGYVMSPFNGSVSQFGEGMVAVRSFNEQNYFSGDATIASLNFTAAAKGEVIMDPGPSELIRVDPPSGRCRVSRILHNPVVAEFNVTMLGDITGPEDGPDGQCNMRDVGLVARYFGQNVPPAPANCDLTGPNNGMPDGQINMRDVGLVARHFGKVDP